MGKNNAPSLFLYNVEIRKSSLTHNKASFLDAKLLAKRLAALGLGGKIAFNDAFCSGFYVKYIFFGENLPKTGAAGGLIGVAAIARCWPN